jgi:hypothetical protein
MRSSALLGASSLLKRPPSGSLRKISLTLPLADTEEVIFLPESRSVSSLHPDAPIAE